MKANPVQKKHLRTRLAIVLSCALDELGHWISTSLGYWVYSHLRHPEDS